MSDARLLQHRISELRQRLGHQSGELQLYRVDESAFIPNPHHVKAEVLPFSDRTRYCLTRCRDCVRAIRQLASHPAIESAKRNDPLAFAHDRCAAMAEAAVRLVQTMPSDFAIQARLCDGLEGLVTALGDYIADLRRAADRTERVNEQHASLTDLLTGLISGSNLALEPFTALADAVLTDARQGEPLRIHNVESISPAADAQSGRDWSARHFAAHSLNVAQVAARVAPHSRYFADQPMSLILVALLHDVGMLHVPFELIADRIPLTNEQSEIMRRHVNMGAEIIEQNLVGGGTLVEAVRTHHVRLDDTGYPQSETTVSPLAHLLAACDVYAALRADRPQRSAFDSQAALMELTMMAQRGQLDPDAVAVVQHLSLHPIGTIVEMQDGSIGRVIAIQDDQPVIEMLMDAARNRWVGQEIRNLAIDCRWSIVKALQRRDIRQLSCLHLGLL